MTIKTKIKAHPDVVDYFRELLFYNKSIKKPKIGLFKTLIYFLNVFFMKN